MERAVILKVVLASCAWVMTLVACSDLDAFTQESTNEVQPTVTPTVGASPVPATPTPGPGRRLDFRIVCNGDMSPASDEPQPARVEWLLGSASDRSELCPNAERSVNWRAEHAILLYRGMMPSGGYRIAAKNAWFDGDTITVVVELTEAGPGTPRTGTITEPYQLIAAETADVTGVTHWRMLTATGRQLAEMHMIP